MGSNLPIELETRAYNLTVIACRFIVNLLCWDERGLNNLPCFNIASREDELFQTILFNDGMDKCFALKNIELEEIIKTLETHTYDAVIRALELAVHCTNNQAMRLATIVDRSVIFEKYGYD